ncbi:MAG: hypothetical protein WCI19_01940 [Betaproteobacteria bacterium]|nr:hypothetical protein [Rhodocyclales bacterium]
MNAIGSISSGNSSTAAQATQRAPEAAEVKGAPEKDGNADDGASKTVKAPAPTVNMNGQKIGQLINVAA